MQKSDILTFLSTIKPSLEAQGVEKLGLFGSYTKESANEFIDIDIAFKLQNDFLQTHDVWNYFRLIENINETIGKQFHKKVELFDLDSASSLKSVISSEVIYV
ncbi:MAG: nucleotidyltransferase domain-containing protein [Campylobacterales bacterium]|nr:nucleotidyltransferase domain-containing protein [Campylobacterales bacterium]